MFCPFKFLKFFLPKGLFGRFVLILFIPLILVQIALSYVFFERHTETVLKVLAENIVTEVRQFSDLLEKGVPFDTLLKSNTQAQFHEISYFPEKQSLDQDDLVNANTQEWIAGFLKAAFDKYLHQTCTLNFTDDLIEIQVITTKGILTFKMYKKRFFSRTTPLVIIWTGTSALLLFGVAVIFMRNQIRPLRRLAEAANRFGRDEQILFDPHEGATEVRQVGLSFRNMQEKIISFVKERTQMLAGVSHDLRTPLTRMKLELAMMEKSDSTASLQEDIQAMQYMIDGFLSFCQTGEYEDLQNVEIVGFLKNICEDSQKNGINITFSSTENNVFFPIKKNLVNRLLRNIIVNSQKYAFNVWVTLKTSPKGLTLFVDDDGPGIPVDKREEVLKPFARLDTARNSETGGIGLGLAIVNDVMKRHGGQVDLSDSSYGGLRISLFFPHKEEA